jgi:serine/threonine protein phosphatase 1
VIIRSMATIAVGDIHGNAAALSDLLDKIFPELTGADTVVFLGDYIDRGSDTRDCIDQILRFQESAPSAVITLMGNHEDWLLRTCRDYTRHSWILGMEAFETIRSYSPDAEEHLRRELEGAGMDLVTGRVHIPYDVFMNHVPHRHMSFFQDLRLYCRTPDAICVHGGIDPLGGELEEQDRESLLWGTDAFPAHYHGSNLIVYGHWNSPALDQAGWPQPAVSGCTIGIDTISHGVLTAIRLPDRRVFQSQRHRN